MNRLRWIVIPMMLVTILATALAAPIQAREPDRQDAGYIISYQTEIIFPAVISFSVAAAIEQGAITSAVLSVFQRDAVIATIELDLNEHVLQSTDLYTQMVYRWPLDSANAPLPFEPVSYRWEIVTQDNITSVVSDEFVFDDQARGPWQVAGRPPVVVHWSDLGMAGELVSDDLLPVHTLLEENTRRALDFQFVIYDTDARYCQEVKDPATELTRLVVISRLDGTEFPCKKADFVAFYDKAGFAFVERPNAGYTPTLDVMTQYMTRSAYALVWENTFVPEWFRAGIGYLYRQRPAPEMLNTVRTAAQLDRLFSLSEMSVELPDTANFVEQDLWAAESYMLVLYLADRFGVDAVFDLARNVGDGDFEGALYALINGDDSVFWDDWYHWILWAEAERAVTWSPYTSQDSVSE